MRKIAFLVHDEHSQLRYYTMLCVREWSSISHLLLGSVDGSNLHSGVRRGIGMLGVAFIRRC